MLEISIPMEFRPSVRRVSVKYPKPQPNSTTLTPPHFFYFYFVSNVIMCMNHLKDSDSLLFHLWRNYSINLHKTLWLLTFLNPLNDQALTDSMDLVPVDKDSQNHQLVCRSLLHDRSDSQFNHS